MEETAVAGRKDWDTERERTGTRLELQGRRRKQTLENLRTAGELSISTVNVGRLKTPSLHQEQSSLQTRKPQLTVTWTVRTWGSDKSIAGGFEESDECVGRSEVELD